jgi:vacuolar-type H+-ATPase subunit H
MDEILQRLLKVEKEAEALISSASKAAEEMRSAAQTAADELKKDLRSELQTEADQLVEAHVQTESARKTEALTAAAQRLDSHVQCLEKQLEAAAQTVVDQVSGTALN